LNLALLLITHDLGVVAETADRVAVMYGGRVVEHGPVREIFRNPQHPYTRGLLASMPRAGQAGRLRTIEGSVPVLGAFPPGCTFHTRCPYRFEPCDKAVPPDYRVGDDHGSRCYLHDAKLTVDSSQLTGRSAPSGRVT
jgi:oligopeptide/dipeptide ABC transporter ATP-binding protein